MLAHRIVVGSAYQTHGRMRLYLAPAVAQRDCGVLRVMVGVMAHPLRSPCDQCHAQRIEHHLRGERGGHRPTDNAATGGVEQDPLPFVPRKNFRYGNVTVISRERVYFTR